jgi:DNA polymerase III subunit epsilon
MSAILDAKWLVIDTETTGLDIATAGVCQLGVFESWRGMEGLRGVMTLDPGHPIPDQASSIHGITDEMVRGKPTLSSIAPRFLDRVREAEVLVGFNSWRYDFPLLSRLLGQEWAQAIEGKPQVDVFVLVCEFDRFKRGKSLSAACERWGVAIERAHNALGDCIATAGLLRAMSRDKRFPRLPQDPHEFEAVLRAMAAQHELERQAYHSRKTA